eukprot:gene506-8020_t
MQCKCGDAAVLRTVSKQGNNIGRQFYSCPNNGKCKFFSWADGVGNFTTGSSGGGSSYKTTKSRDPNPNLPTIVPKCPVHSVACSLKTTKKPGPNQGRNFFICPEKNQGSTCLFIWQDEFVPDDTNSCDMKSELDYKCVVNFEAISDDTLEIVLPEEREYLFPLRSLIKDISGNVFIEENICTIPMLKKGELKYNIEKLPVKIKVNDVPDTLFNIIKAFPIVDCTNDDNIDWDKLPFDLVKSLFKYQKEGFIFGVRREGKLLIGDEMGLGKTIQAIAISFYFHQDWPLLIICPASLRVNWSMELEKWLAPWIKPQDINIIIHGKSSVNSKINIISYELAVSMNEKIVAQKFKSILIDECHYLKNPTTARYRTISPFIKAAKRCVLITGTPALSRPNELFTQLDMMLSSKITWFDKYQFGTRYCNASNTLFGFDDKGASNLHELNFLLTRTVMLRRLKDEVLTDLPPKVREHVHITIEDKYRSELQKGLSKLKQNSSNLRNSSDPQDHSDKKFENNVEYNQLFQLSGQAKLKSVLNYLDGILEYKQKFLIFAHHIAILDAIQAHVKKQKIGFMRIDGSTPTMNRQKNTDKFQNDPECLVAILSIKAAGTGLTLHAASHVIFAELMWNPGELFQAEDRVHRVGQKYSVTVTYLLGKETLDDIIWTKIKSKLDVVENSLNGITNSELIHKKIDIDSSNIERVVHDSEESQGRIQIFDDDSEDDLDALDELDRIEQEYLNKNKPKKEIKKAKKIEKFKDIKITSSNLLDFMHLGKGKKLPYNVIHNKDGTINNEVAKVVNSKTDGDFDIPSLPVTVTKKRKLFVDADDKPISPKIASKIVPKINEVKEETIEKEDIQLSPPPKKKKFFDEKEKTPTKEKIELIDFEKFSFTPTKKD